MNTCCHSKEREMVGIDRQSLAICGLAVLLVATATCAQKIESQYDKSNNFTRYKTYPYARPMPYYRPNVNVYAPRYSSVNVSVNRTNINVNQGKTNVNNRTPRPTSLSSA